MAKMERVLLKRTFATPYGRFPKSVDGEPSEEFEKWAEAEAQKDAYLEGTVVSDTSDSPFLVHPGSFPGEKNK